MKNIAVLRLLCQHSAIFQCILLPALGHAVTTDAKRHVSDCTKSIWEASNQQPLLEVASFERKVRLL